MNGKKKSLKKWKCETDGVNHVTVPLKWVQKVRDTQTVNVENMAKRHKKKHQKYLNIQK